MRCVSASEARADLARLVRDVAMGGAITITKHGAPVATLAPISKPVKRERSREDIQTSIDNWRRYREDHEITLGDDVTIMGLVNEGRHR